MMTPQLATYGDPTTSTRVYLNDQSGGFTLQPENAFTGFASQLATYGLHHPEWGNHIFTYHAFAFGDFDGDHHVDVAVGFDHIKPGSPATFAEECAFLWKNDGSGGFTPVSAEAFPLRTAPVPSNSRGPANYLAWADLDVTPRRCASSPPRLLARR